MAMPVFWLWPTPPSTARTMRMYSDLVSRSSREVVVISPAGDGVRQGGLGWSGRGQGGRASQSMKERHLQDRSLLAPRLCSEPLGHLPPSPPSLPVPSLQPEPPPDPSGERPSLPWLQAAGRKEGFRRSASVCSRDPGSSRPLPSLGWVGS